MAILTYFLEVNTSLVLFIILYRVSFKKLTFFAWKRFYLLGGILLSFIIPWIKTVNFINVTSNHPKIITQLVTKKIVVYQHSKSVVEEINQSTVMHPINIVFVIYWVIFFYYFAKIFLDIISVVKIISVNQSQKLGNTRIIWLLDSIPAFSFFNYIFITREKFPKETLPTVITHEQTHCQQWHTLDWLLIRCISALFWFNPIMILWKKSISINHEFIADSRAVKMCNSLSYSHILIDMAISRKSLSIVHCLSHNQLKSRIVMLHKIRSKKISLVRFLLVLPLLMLIFTLSSCEKLVKTGENRVLNSPKNMIVFNDLVGTWQGTKRTIINSSDGKSTTDIHADIEGVRVCLPKLILNDDGSFQMSDEQTGQKLKGRWESDIKGVAVKFYYVDKDLLNEGNSSSVLYNRDGSIATEPLSKTLSIDITSLRSGKMQAWQNFYTDNPLVAGTIYYEYQK